MATLTDSGRAHREATRDEYPPNLVVVEPADNACRDYDIADESVRGAIYRCQREHFWFASRNDVILEMIRRIGLRPPARVLEVGCGTGTVLSHMIDEGYRADGVEMHLELCVQAARACREARIYCLDVLGEGAGAIDACYDAVGLFDVLEHVEEPESLLARCARLGASGGIVVGTVPALMSLWSPLDEAMGHRRRYDMSMMGREIEAAGLRPLGMCYFFQTLAPPIWLQRKLMFRRLDGVPANRASLIRDGLAPPPGPVNGVLRAVCRFERVVSRLLPLSRLPGASLFFAAVKD